MDKGGVFHSSLFTLRSFPAAGPSRFAAVVPSKAAAGAAARNRMRRRIYEAIRPLYSSVSAGSHAIIFAKQAAVKAEFKAMSEDLRALFVKGRLLK